MTADVGELSAQQQGVMTVMAEVVVALHSDAPLAALVAQLVTLRDHLEKVFDAEEAVMKALCFPTIELHQLDHTWLRTVLVELCSSTQETADPQETRRRLADHFQSHFSTLMTEHQQTYDQELSAYLEKV
jgi:hemerythrin